MIGQPVNRSTFSAIRDYVLELRNPSPYWRVQATAWGIVIVVLVAGAALFAILALSSVFGGGTVTFEAVGSPGPVAFSHYAHMSFQAGKYKDCKTCHDKLFATQKYGTYVLAALRDSPPRKVRIGLEASTLYVPGSGREDGTLLVTYDVPRACATCATGSCHDGKESFSRMECLKCHRAY
ncbi:MAG: hypothetical protein HY914_16725 [Desulfomonile tiedjei]|nr:hypothetical protein [Desulfomonile tiedjei]